MKYLKSFENIDSLKTIKLDAEYNNKILFDDLLDVGTKKALGYLPLSTIKDYGGESALDDLIDWSVKNKLKYIILMPNEYYGVDNGALYIWDEEMLNIILIKYKKILQDANIPILPSEYVEFINSNGIYEDEYPEAYSIIGKTFNDIRFR